MRASLLLAVVFLGACTFGRLDGLTGGSPSTPDAGTVPDAAPAPVDAGDAATPADAADAAAPFFVDSFDDADTCSNSGYNSTYTQASTYPHTSLHACRTCAAGSSETTYSFEEEVKGAPAVPGARYHAKIWFRRTGSNRADPQIYFELRSFVREPYADIETSTSQAPIGGDWAQLEVDLLLTKPADAVDIVVSQPFGDGYCFVVDDLEVVRLE